MEERLNQEISNSFKCMLNIKDTLTSYENYYRALSSWVKNNIDNFSWELQKRTRLDVLLSINPDKYIVDNPELSLELEYKRIGERDYETIDDLAMTIGDTLWDLVTIRTGKDCPVCIYDELRYVVVKNKEKGLLKVVLECESCGWTEYTDGTEWNEGIVEVFPANQEDISNNNK